MLKRDHSLQRVGRIKRKDGVVGSLAYVAVESTVGGLPVIVSVSAPIDTFAPDT
jgi:hypothetical protein